MKDYKNPIKATINKAKDNLLDIADSIYQQGYEAGKADTPFTDTEEAEKKAYNRGLNDAWKLVKRIESTPEDGGLTNEQIVEVFGQYWSSFELYRVFSVGEAMDLMKAYEDKQKQKQKHDIKVGDEVMTEIAEHGVAVRDTYYVGVDKEPFTLIWFGTHMSSCPVSELAKTGRHYPQIAEVLAELRGAENDE